MKSTFEEQIELGLAQDLKGWDWSWYDARTTVDPLPWDYESMAKERVRLASAVLDIDTGGGEIYSRLGPFPMVAWATEGYPPNLSIARARLEPLGIQVADVSEIGGLLPFIDETFDLVLNRHGGHYAEELERIIQPGGRFLTQQVGGANCVELNYALMEKPYYMYQHCTLDYIVTIFKDAGLRILSAREAFPSRKLFDIASVVFYLRNISWQIEDFTVERYYDGLQRIHKILEETGLFTIHEHRLLIEADKPDIH